MSVIAALEALPNDGLTVSVLRTLDAAAPGEWDNVTRFDAFLADFAGTDNPAVLRTIRQRASDLEGNPRYAQAMQVFALVDRVDQLAAGAAVANKVGGLLGALGGGFSFLENLTPKPATTQCLDAGVKLIAEVLAFGLMHDVKTDGRGALTRFAGALEDYAKYDLIRIAAWVVFDGLVPLGPQFLGQILDTWRDAANSELLTGNKVFTTLAKDLPGEGVDGKRDFIVQALDTTGDWVQRFVADKGLTQEGALSQLGPVLKIAGQGGDYLSAAIDASTNYYAHTGVQTVARTLARHATEGQRRGVWRDWVGSHG